jgi:tetratricopeptide (TPR) repeat protein
MPSILPGFEYDIFISYRQKDNKYDGWVTEFVNNLKKELEATFKEDITVYFDINPYDGLLETHDVDASLKGKLKCLVFIPVISRTYCDPKSFAWEHEFKAFVELASQDQFGLKVKLPNGNVASRVLPVHIYYLDNADTNLCELVLGGVLRGIEFIYAEPGVNRPLKPDDDEKINLNKTKYRNQINKIANAIKDIISGLRTEPAGLSQKMIQFGETSEEVLKEEKKEVLEKSSKLSKRRLLIGSVLFAILLLAAAILAYPKIFKPDTLEKLRSSGERISVAVMPFQNMTGDTTLINWQDGIQYNLISYLSNFPDELSVRQRESVSDIINSKGLTNYQSITTSVASSISEKLDADVLINGSFNQSGPTLRFNAQIVDTKTNNVVKSFQIDGTKENILHLIDSLSVMAKNVLVISKMGDKLSPEFMHLSSVNSPEALRYFISGQNAFNDRDWNTAAKLYSQATDKDSSFTLAYVMLSVANLNQGLYQEARKACQVIYNKRDQMPYQQKIMAEWIYALIYETPQEEIKYVRQLLEIDDQYPNYHFMLGMAYLALNQYDKGIPEYEKALEIYKKWGLKPSYTGTYSHLGPAYHKTGQYLKEKELYKKAEIDFPDNPSLIYNQAVLSLSEGNIIEANRYIDKYTSIRKEESVPEVSIISSLAGIYSDADILDKAEEYYRQALWLEPENPLRINNLAYFLIDKDRNINEGMELADRALKSNAGNHNFLNTEGWGLYKQGKYLEALEVLQKSWDLRMKNAIYDHEAFIHLEAAKKAVANLKKIK